MTRDRSAPTTVTAEALAAEALAAGAVDTSPTIVSPAEPDPARGPADGGMTPPGAVADASARAGEPVVVPEPTALTRVGLVRINLYWLALTSMWTAISIQMAPVIATRLICPAGLDGPACASLANVAPDQLKPLLLGIRLTPEVALGLVGMLGAIIAFTVQPVSAALSDSTRSRWGRRRPWILAGTVLQMLMLLALAWSGSFVAFALFFLALQFAGNVAQGPYQGFIPDLVPEAQVGIASGLKATMNAGGQLVGAVVGGLAVALSDLRLGFVALAILVAATALPTVTGVRERGLPAPPPRSAGPRVEAVRRALAEAWANRSFVWLLASMLFLLMATATLLVVAQFYLTRSLGYSEVDAAAAIVVLLAISVISAIVMAVLGGGLSDRFGRRPVIWLSAAVSAAGMALLVIAQAEPELSIGGARFPAYGLAAIPVAAGAGMYLAANWALLVDVIPRSTAGRYLGLSNIVTASSGALAALAASLVMTFATELSGDVGLGPRGALLVALVWYAIGSLALRNVRSTRPELA